jgi:hypothetical protein
MAVLAIFLRLGSWLEAILPQRVWSFANLVRSEGLFRLRLLIKP